MPGDLFRPEDLPFSPLTRAALEAARPLLDRFLGLRELTGRYGAARCLEGSFAARALRVLNIRLQIAGAVSAVPTNGPLVIVANHPFGALDGLALMAALEPFRSDVRVLANGLLAHIPEMRDVCFFVDPFGGPHAAARSRAGLRAAHLWLRQGHALVAFPAGEVAHGRLVRGTREDSPWSDSVARLAVNTGAAVVPVHVHGTNSAGFYAAGRVHPKLRTALLPRELLKSAGRHVAISIGCPIAPPALSRSQARDRVGAGADVRASRFTRELRAAVESLRDRAASNGGDEAIVREIAALPAHARLCSSGSFEVYAAPAAEIPRTLEAIGRLREQTYRAIGEGTGHDVDLDRFDRSYTHLFVWDRAAGCLVGAYRIGNVAAIVEAEGVNGLYTHQLFQFDEAFVAKLGPALELGRSWVRAEYQKNYNALLMLWKGIGRFVVERSRARVLFGPVSISARYSDASHALLAAFLEQNYGDASLSRLVRPRHPRPAGSPARIILPGSIEDAQKAVAELEGDGKGVPVLLRQYLKLNARLIGFNVDPDFGNALDALMMVDLAQVDRALLHRYLGADGTARFLARHHSPSHYAA